MPMKPEVPSVPMTSAMRGNGRLRETLVIDAPNAPAKLVAYRIRSR